MSCPRLPALALLAVLGAPAAAAEYRFDGHLEDRGRPADGVYDIQLTAFPAEKAGASLAAPIVFERVPVSAGRFELGFELPAQLDAAWVEVAVREPGQGAFSRIPARTKAIAAPLIGQCWSTTGDSASNPATNFLGTTDNQPLVLRVGNRRAVRIEPTLSAPNLISGISGNTVTGSVVGATIGGGGGTAEPNRVTDDFGTICGGADNRAGDDTGTPFDAGFATVGGGITNIASGPLSTIGGGQENTANGSRSTVGGGVLNTASGFVSTVGGGQDNTASGSNSAVGGGQLNCAGGALSWVGGYRAKVRPGSNSGAPGTGCFGVAQNGTSGDEGTFVWADRHEGDFVSTGPNQFLVRAGNGVVLQRAIGAETSARRPRGYFNVAAGDSGLAQPASPSTNTVATFESGTDAFIRVLTPDTEERGIAFGEPGGGLSDGAIAYTPANTMQFRTNGNITRMTLGADGTLALNTLGAAGSTAVCRNASNQLSSCSSSARYKEQLAELGLGLAEVLRMRPVGYVWKDGGMADVGFVAEEIARIDERLVTRNAKGEVEGVKYERLSAVLAGAVQELAARESLQAEEIAGLKAEQAASSRRQAEIEGELAELRALVAGLRRGQR